MRDPTQYVPSHAGIWTHRKFVRLQRRLVTLLTPIGGAQFAELISFACLHSLWHAANTQAGLDGALGGWDDLDLASAARWPGDPEQFRVALVAEGWLEVTDAGALRVHDWEEYAGDWRVKREMKREADRERQARKRAEGRSMSQNVTRDIAIVTRDIARLEMSPDVTRDNGDVARDMGGVSPDVTRDNGDVAHREKKREEEKRREERRGDLSVAPAPAAPDPPPPSPPPVDRSRRNPDAPPPREGTLLSADEVSMLRAGVGVDVHGQRRRRLGFAGVGFMEDPSSFPETPDELLEKHRDELGKSFPMLDGRPPRPSLRDAVAAKWGSYVAARARVGGGHANAYAALKTWLGEMSQKHRVSWEREREVVVDGSAAIEATRKILAPLEGPHPAETIDEDGRKQIATLLAGIGKPKPLAGEILEILDAEVQP